MFCIPFSVGEDYYQLLGVPKNANNREIRKAFKRLAVTMHPDKNQVCFYWETIPNANIVAIFESQNSLLETFLSVTGNISKKYIRWFAPYSSRLGHQSSGSNLPWMHI